MKNITFFIFIFRNDEKSNLKGYYSLVTQKRKKEKKKERRVLATILSICLKIAYLVFC